LSAEKIELGGTPMLLSLMSDITERQNLDAALRQLNGELEQRIQSRTAELQSQEMLLRTVLDSMGDGVMYCSESTIQYINPALAELCGYSAMELTGQPKSLLDFGSALDDEASLFADESQVGEETWRGEAGLRRKDGEALKVALTVRRLRELRSGVG